ncbi:hypothetical protein D3C71_1592470 [compost metagenome]
MAVVDVAAGIFALPHHEQHDALLAGLQRGEAGNIEAGRGTGQVVTLGRIERIQLQTRFVEVLVVQRGFQRIQTGVQRAKRGHGATCAV